MREISPAHNISVDEYISLMPPTLRRMVDEVRSQKFQHARIKPSATLIDRSTLMAEGHRRSLLDKVASLVDENYVGRSEMCLQFADLLNRALTYLQFPSRPVVGTAIYYAVDGNEIFRWTHAWVRVGNETIDGNVDSLRENPCVPKEVSVAPYWGPIDKTPPDRKLREKHGELLPSDVDVEKSWWPDLKHWIDTNLLVRQDIGGVHGDT